MTTFEIITHYTPEPGNPCHLDDRITKAVGFPSSFSGCGMREGATRDLGFQTNSFAEACEARLRALNVLGVRTVFIREQ